MGCVMLKSYKKYKFIILIYLVWILNIIDAIQTYIYHKHGFLYEANCIMAFIINKNINYMFIFKLIGLLIITFWLAKKWNIDNKSGRTLILKLLYCAIIFNIIIILLPHIKLPFY